MSIYDKASLVLIPSGTKTSKVYSQKPVNGDGDFTFSRSTAATRVNADGNIEKETQNLLLQSNNLTTTWGATGGTMVGGQADKDGGTDAWVFTANNTSQSRFNQTISVSGVNTISMYAKAGTANFLCLYIIGSGDPRAFFNLSTGAVGSTGANIDANIEDVGNGWYRCSLTFDRTSSTLWCFVSNTDGDFNSAIGDSIYIQDAQLEQGLVARDYIETTTAAVEGGITDNVPRLDYTDSSCPALLLEPQRTNLVEHSEYLGSYSYVTRITTQENYGTSPEGLTNSTAIFNTAVYGAHNIAADAISFTSGTTYTFSVFAKAGTLSKIKLTIINAISTRVDFDLSAGTATGTGASIENYGNGWYRCVYTIAATSTTTNGRAWVGLLNNNGDTNYLGSTSEYIELYGFQVEEASYATSYIPTYGTSVTRNNDRPFNVSLPIYDNEEASIYYEVSYDNVTETATNWVSLQIDVATNDWFFFGKNGDDNLRMYLKANNAVISSQILDNVLQANQTHKMLFKYSASGASLYLDGTEVISYNQAITTPSFNRLSVCNSAGTGATTTINMKKLLVFPTALTDQEAIDLTTI